MKRLPIPIRSLACLAFGLLLLLPGGAVADEQTPETTFFEDALEGVRLGTPALWNKLVVFPLVAVEKPEPMPVDVAWSAKALTIRDRTDREHEYDLVLANAGDHAVLLPGGSVITGGKLERVIPMDVLIPPKTKALEIDALAASTERTLIPEKLRRGQQVAHVVAPKYLREKILYERSQRTVRRFLRHFDETRTRNEQPTLSGTVAARPLQAYCIACQGEAANFPRLRREKTVGWISALGPRLHAMELFADNTMVSASFDAYLTSHAFRAAAVALREEARDLKPPKDGEKSAERLARLRKDAEDLLHDLRERALQRDDDLAGASGGEALDLWIGGARGRAIAMNGRLVHAAVYPHDPFEHALYADPLEIEQTTQVYDEKGTGELERRGAYSRLTEYEKRLLERRRERGVPAITPGR